MDISLRHSKHMCGFLAVLMCDSKKSHIPSVSWPKLTEQLDIVKSFRLFGNGYNPKRPCFFSDQSLRLWGLPLLAIPLRSCHAYALSAFTVWPVTLPASGLLCCYDLAGQPASIAITDVGVPGLIFIASAILQAANRQFDRDERAITKGVKFRSAIRASLRLFHVLPSVSDTDHIQWCNTRT